MLAGITLRLDEFRLFGTLHFGRRENRDGVVIIYGPLATFGGVTSGALMAAGCTAVILRWF
jgi:hypothetical protein